MQNRKPLLPLSKPWLVAISVEHHDYTFSLLLLDVDMFLIDAVHILYAAFCHGCVLTHLLTITIVFVICGICS